MQFSSQNKYPRNSGRPFFNQKGPVYRKNDRIRSVEVFVIGPNKEPLGVMPTQEAQKMARNQGLDLVEISPTARPPVCKIVDFGKLMYEESKKSKTTKQPVSEIKEFKFRLNIDRNDYETKVRQAEKALHKGSKVKLVLVFRGRELEHSKRGLDIMKEAIKDLSHMGQPDAEAKFNAASRNIISILSPSTAKNRKLKWNVSEVDESEPS